jgi:hypothetical protein
MSIPLFCLFAFTNFENFKTTFNNSSQNNTKDVSNIKCPNEINLINQLNDSVHHYLEHSYLTGIKKTIKKEAEIIPLMENGTLLKIVDTEKFKIDSLEYSYPYLTLKAKKLLEEIGESFQNQLTNTNLKSTRIIITSILRTTNTIKRLRRKNKNAIRYSPHLHGTTFDITYINFDNEKEVSKSEKEVLKEILAKTLHQLRSNKKCWVTFEQFQTCFHVVTR